MIRDEIYTEVSAACAIWLPDRGRWLCKVSKGRIYSAWSLAGAMLFLFNGQGRASGILEILERKGVKFEIRVIREVFE